MNLLSRNNKPLITHFSLCTLFLITLLLFGGCNNQQKEIEKIPKNSDLSNDPESIQNLANLSVYPFGTKPTSTIEFMEEVSIADDRGIGQMGTMAVDEQGRIFIAQGGFRQNRQTIHLFSSDGTHLTTIGREGRGPGEFLDISNLQIHSNHLYAYDNRLQRVNIFSLDSLEHVRTVILNPDSWDDNEELKGTSPHPDHFYVTSDRSMLFGFTEPLRPDNVDNRYRRYFKMDLEGNISSDKIYEEKDVGFYQGTGVPPLQLADSPTLAYHRSSLTAISDSGHIYTAWTDEFLIKVYNSQGEYLRSFYHPYEKSDLEWKEIRKRYQNRSNRFQQGIRNMETPETWPALHYMITDDENRLWIATITDNKNQYEWWVVDTQGRPLAKFKWPGRHQYRDVENRRIRAVKDGDLYALTEDEETGIQEIVRYRIEFEGN